MIRRTTSMVTLIAMSFLLLSGCVFSVPVVSTTDSMSADSFHQTMAEVKTHGARGEPTLVEGAWAELVSNSEAARITLVTRDLEPGNAYTLWWAIVNQPDQCATVPCSAADLLGRTDAVQGNVTYGGGGIAHEDGTLTFSSYLPAGDMAGGWFSNEFADPTTAEIHLVINDHGPVLEGMAAEMINTYRGGCTDESLPPPFPDTAKADGAPGPNACLLYQFAIFQQ